MTVSSGKLSWGDTHDINIGNFVATSRSVFGDSLEFHIRISLMQSCYWTKSSYLLSWSHYFESCMVGIMTWLTITECLSEMTTYMFYLSKSLSRSSFLVTHHQIVTNTGATSREELLTLPGHTRTSPGFSGARIPKDLKRIETIFSLQFYYLPLLLKIFSL